MWKRNKYISVGIWGFKRFASQTPTLKIPFGGSTQIIIKTNIVDSTRNIENDSDQIA